MRLLAFRKRLFQIHMERRKCKMTISISSLVIGGGFLFLAGIVWGVGIMCIVSVKKISRLNNIYFVSDSDTERGEENT